MTLAAASGTLPEPWLRGPIEGVHPLAAPILYAFQQAREDLARSTAGLTLERIWATPHGFGSVGFHLRHIAGSTERLMTYLQGRALSEEQLAALAVEHEPAGAGRDDLLALVDRAFRDAEVVVRAIDPASLAEPRTVGRKQLPTTVIGLLTHTAEHTQRHVGQAISAAKLAGRACYQEPLPDGRGSESSLLPDTERGENAIQNIVGGGSARDGVDGA